MMTHLFSMSNPKKTLALVLSGGGARGAYEAGVIHYLRTMLPLEISRKRRFDVICGSSVGAINACFLAASAHDLAHQGNRLYEIWKHLRQENVYRRDMVSFARLIAYSFFGITRNLFRRVPAEDAAPIKKKHFRGLLNTAPLLSFLRQIIPWGQISVNIRNELVKAVSVTATNIHTGRLELFVEKHPSLPYTGHYVFHETKLESYHALASAALPFFFETVRIHKNYYMDGGIRLNTPMSPAIQLGAEKILVIGLHHREERAEESEVSSNGFILPPEPPSLGLILGKVLSALFLDRLDYDLEQMTRINRVIEWGEGRYGTDFIEKINAHLKDHHIVGDIANRGLKKLTAFHIYPSRDIREIFAECIEGQQFFAKGLTSFERALLKLLDVDVRSSKDFLSFIMFYPDFLQRLLELGFEDARANHDKLVEFLQD